MRRTLSSEKKKERCNAAALGMHNAKVALEQADSNSEPFDLMNNNNHEITLKNLMIVNGLSKEQAEKFLKLSEKDRMKEDLRILSLRDDFYGKVAKTIIENGYTKMSAKQAEILSQKSIFMYEPILTSYDHYRLEKWEKESRYRQAGSSLRRR